jgi:hypothetical protein
VNKIILFLVMLKVINEQVRRVWATFLVSISFVSRKFQTNKLDCEAEFTKMLDCSPTNKVRELSLDFVPYWWQCRNSNSNKKPTNLIVSYFLKYFL